MMFFISNLSQNIKLTNLPRFRTKDYFCPLLSVGHFMATDNNIFEISKASDCILTTMGKLDRNGLNKASRIWLFVGILFIAVNLRPALSSIGPLIDMIRQDVGLSETLLGLLTTLPLIAFGVVSTITPLFTKRYGIGNTLLGSLILLAVGIIIRSIGGVFELYLGTIFLGIAIAFGNVLIPAMIKRNFPHKAGLVTSLYSGIMSLGAAFAAGLSVPLAMEMNLGWRGSLGVWAVLAVIAVIIWIPNLKRINRTVPNRSFKEAMK